MVTKIIKFVIVGSTGTLINFTVFTLFFTFNKNAQIAASLAFLVALTSNFYFNKVWTFNYITKGNIIKKWFQHLLATSFGLAINLFILYILYDRYNLNPYISQFLGIFGGLIFNFYFSSRIFKHDYR